MKVQKLPNGGPSIGVVHAGGRGWQAEALGGSACPTLSQSSEAEIGQNRGLKKGLREFAEFVELVRHRTVFGGDYAEA